MNILFLFVFPRISIHLVIMGILTRTSFTKLAHGKAMARTENNRSYSTAPFRSDCQNEIEPNKNACINDVGNDAL